MVNEDVLFIPITNEEMKKNRVSIRNVKPKLVNYKLERNTNNILNDGKKEKNIEDIRKLRLMKEQQNKKSDKLKEDHI